MTYPKLYIGPMSKTIVDIVCSYSSDRNIPMGLVASRRQIDGNNPGYANNWDIKSFRSYINSKIGNIMIERDHGGPEQGLDNGFDSLSEDVSNVDIIHLDVWKISSTIDQAADLTAGYMTFCFKKNENCKFEVGTEFGIFPYSSDQLDQFLGALHKKIDSKIFGKIVYAVIQSGTLIKGMKNIGIYDPDILYRMILVCKKFNLLSKEHNADYIQTSRIQDNFKLGLDAINIAPQIASIENSFMIKVLSESQRLTLLGNCVKSNQIVRWFGEQYNPNTNQEEVLTALAHYYRPLELNSEQYYAKLRANLFSFFDKILDKG